MDTLPSVIIQALENFRPLTRVEVFETFTPHLYQHLDARGQLRWASALCGALLYITSISRALNQTPTV